MPEKNSLMNAAQTVALALFALAACGKAPGDSDSGMATDAGTDAGPQIAGQTDVKGKVADMLGRGVGDAVVSVGTISATADWQGVYELKGVPAGQATIQVKADWFTAAMKPVMLQPNVPAQVDVVLEAQPLKVLPADDALATAYGQTFDWTMHKVSVEVAAKPTRAKIDAALYLRNPALYRSSATQPMLTPSPLPALTGGPRGFNFPIPQGAANAGQQALDTTTLVDTLALTPLTEAEKAAFFVWDPAVKSYLRNWDLNASLNLYYVGQAVESQSWGGNAQVPPQSLRRVFLHQGEIWVELVFEKFVSLGAGITDSDGDGRKEVFGRVRASHVGGSVSSRLETDYLGVSFSTLQLRDNLSTILDDLYTKTMPTVESVIGVPYAIPGTGTVQYPFVVLKHSGGVVNVLLVRP